MTVWSLYVHTVIWGLSDFSLDLYLYFVVVVVVVVLYVDCCVMLDSAATLVRVLCVL
jgi:hypothetical protein